MFSVRVVPSATRRALSSICRRSVSIRIFRSRAVKSFRFEVRCSYSAPFQPPAQRMISPRCPVHRTGRSGSPCPGGAPRIRRPPPGRRAGGPPRRRGSAPPPCSTRPAARAAPGRGGAPPRVRGGRTFGRSPRATRRFRALRPVPASGRRFRAVVDDERLGPGGLDAHPEADKPVVPGDPGLVGGWRVSTVRLVRVSLTLAVRLPVVVLMMRRGLAGGRKADSTQRQHFASGTRTVGNTRRTGVRRDRLNSSISH